MSQPFHMPWDPAPTDEVRNLDRAQAQRDEQRRQQLLQLHDRLSALVFWLVITLAMLGLSTQIGWGA